MFRLHESPSDEKYPFKIERKKWILGWCNKQGGVGIELGCGHSRVSDDILATDIVPRGGITNKVEGFISEADIFLSTNMLPIYCSGEAFDFIIASHLIEHLNFSIITVKRWINILKKGGILIIITPDAELWEHSSDHIHEFTKDELKELFSWDCIDILELDNSEWEKTEIKCVVRKNG